MASRPSRDGQEGGSRGGVGAQRHRIQCRPSGRPRACGRDHRRRRCRRGVRPQRGVLRRRDCAGGSVEAAGSPSHDAARDPGRCDGRRAQIRPLFTITTRPDLSIGSHDVFRECAARVDAVGRQEHQRQSDRIRHSLGLFRRGRGPWRADDAAGTYAVV